MEGEDLNKALEVVQPTALEAIERAQIDIQIATAKKYPRPALSVIKQRMLDYATLDEETAEECFYTLKRKDMKTGRIKIIQGPSVRLAEIALVCFGNMRAGARIVDNDGKAVTSQGVCHDLESNTMVSMEVRRRITDSGGRTYGDDLQALTGNAANAISFRNAVLKVIPGALTHPVYEAARAVAIGTSSTLAAKREKIIKRLEAMGATLERILAAVEKQKLEDVGLAELEILIGLGTAIKSGDTTVEEAFPEKRPEIKLPELGADALKAAASQERSPAEAPTPAPAEKPKAERHCSRCGQLGHDARQCKVELVPASAPIAAAVTVPVAAPVSAEASQPTLPELTVIREVDALPDPLATKDRLLRWKGVLWRVKEDSTAWQAAPEDQAPVIARTGDGAKT